VEIKNDHLCINLIRNGQTLSSHTNLDIENVTSFEILSSLSGQISNDNKLEYKNFGNFNNNNNMNIGLTRNNNLFSQMSDFEENYDVNAFFSKIGERVLTIDSYFNIEL
jgi:hypothetical protein